MCSCRGKRESSEAGNIGFSWISSTMRTKWTHTRLTMSVCLSVRMPSSPNSRIPRRILIDICRACNAVGGSTKIVLLNFLQQIIPTWRASELVMLDRHLQFGHTAVNVFGIILFEITAWRLHKKMYFVLNGIWSHDYTRANRGRDHRANLHDAILLLI